MVRVGGDPERLKAMGFMPKADKPVPDPLPLPPAQTPLLTELGLENASIEEKSRVITETWLNTLTVDDISKLGANGVKEVAKLAGLGGTKKQDPSGNAVIMAIIQALSTLGVKPPEMKIIEVEPLPALGEASE